MSKFSIAALQLELGNQNNLSILQDEIEKTIKRFPWIDMVVLGELNAYGLDRDFAQANAGEFESFFSDLAKRLSIWLVPGSYYETVEEKLFNTATVFSPTGKVVARHRKIYPFLPYEKNITCGNQFTVFDVPDIGRFGLIICYDQWFPEVSRNLAWLGAEVILCPTLTDTIDRPTELTLAKANAVVNQCYFLNVNAVGELGNGQSVVLGPQGETIYQANVGREIIPVELDLQHVKDVRERGLHGLCQTLKSFRDHRLDFPVYQDRSDEGEFSKLGPLKLPDSNE